MQVGWDGEALGKMLLSWLWDGVTATAQLCAAQAVSHWMALSHHLQQTQEVLGWLRAVLVSAQEPRERVALASALGSAPQATALNFHHTWLKGSLGRSNQINPAQTSFYLMGRSQLMQEVGQAMEAAAARWAQFSHTSFHYKTFLDTIKVYR